MIRYLLALAVAFAFAVALMPAVIAFAKKLKVRQTILSYVDNHASKSGTPTMGGVGFVAAAVAVTFAFLRGSSSLAVMVAVLTLGFGLIGFIDDFIKVFFKQNKGLFPWQKIVFQFVVAIIMAFFVYFSPFVGDKLYVPFTLNEISLGWFTVPFYVFVFVAFTNAVNLTDGLDGLAGKTAVAYTIFFAAVIAVIVYRFGIMPDSGAEYKNLIVFCFALIGALCGFLLFNSYPAAIFMGDTGALALGGALAGLAVVSKLVFIAPIIGLPYVVSCVSDVIQVAHYKRTKRRVFLMAPFHHHLERKGIHENKIVTGYTLVTLFTGVVTLLIILAIN